MYAASITEENTAHTEKTAQELMPMMARGCSNGRPGSPVKCTGSWLSSNGIDDPESYKSDYVSNGSLFDIYRDTSNNNALWLGNKSGTIWIPCF